MKELSPTNCPYLPYAIVKGHWRVCANGKRKWIKAFTRYTNAKGGLHKTKDTSVGPSVFQKAPARAEEDRKAFLRLQNL